MRLTRHWQPPAAGQGLAAGWVLSVALHGLGLYALANAAPSGAPNSDAAGVDHSAGSPPLRVELVGSRWQAQQPAEAPHAPQAVAPPDVPLQPSMQPVMTSVVSTPLPAQPSPSDAAAVSEWDLVGQQYVAADALTQRPSPVGDVDVAYPERAKQDAAVSVVLTLYLDEHGHVDFLRLQNPDHDDAWTQAATQAFEAATFTPGVLDGQPVKSRVRIEVSFDSNGLPESVAANGASTR